MSVANSQSSESISIHAAREGGDHSAQPQVADFIVFQSTPPVKAATNEHERTPFNDDISIHAAREGGDALRSFAIPTVSISIHAAREGGDFAFRNQLRHILISIHAAREGGDRFVRRHKIDRVDFNPRRP